MAKPPTASTSPTTSAVPASPPRDLPAAVRLDEFPSHQWATVVDVIRPAAGQVEGTTRAEDRELALRLSEIGFVPGEAVRIVASGVPGREPLAVRIGHTTFALRRHEAAMIRVTPGAEHHG